MDKQQRKVSEEFDRYRDCYEESVNSAISFTGMKVDLFTRIKVDYFEDILRKKVGDLRHCDVVDIGCGVGLYHPLLQPKVSSLTGIDVSQASIERAREYNREVEYACYDGHTLPCETGRFDAAMAICVMHHVPEKSWQRVINEMARVVRPGGVVCVFEHNPRNPLTRRVVDKCPFDADAVLLKASRVEALLEAAGLGQVRSRYILNIPPIGRVLRYVDGLGSFLALGAQYYTVGSKG